MEMRPVPGFPTYKITDDGRVWSDKHARFLKARPNNKYGHLRVSLWEGPRHSQVFVHRLVLLAYVGPSPDGKPFCRHLNGDPSDNRPCNLKWGTKKENAQDMSNHGHCGRADIRGEKNSMSKLTREQVVEIRNLWSQGTTQRAISERYRIHRAYVSLIVMRKTWTECGGAPYPNDSRSRRPKGSSNAHAKLIEQDVVKMRARYADGETVASIARSVGISWENCKKIVTRKAWKHVQ